jgi:hypothetical protein
MCQHHVDRDGQEVTTGEDGDRLDEGVQRVEGEPGEGSNRPRFVVDEVQVLVDPRVVQQPVEPVGEELVIRHVQKQVDRQHGIPHEGVLHPREVRIADFDKIYQGSLAEDVQRGPLDVVPVGLPLET